MVVDTYSKMSVEKLHKIRQSLLLFLQDRKACFGDHQGIRDGVLFSRYLLHYGLARRTFLLLQLLDSLDDHRGIGRLELVRRRGLLLAVSIRPFQVLGG